MMSLNHYTSSVYHT